MVAVGVAGGVLLLTVLAVWWWTRPLTLPPPVSEAHPARERLTKEP
jgi:hypothetical protein